MTMWEALFKAVLVVAAIMVVVSEIRWRMNVRAWQEMQAAHILRIYEHVELHLQDHKKHIEVREAFVENLKSVAMRGRS